MLDLHLHTNMSDGTDAPLELLEKVQAAGCNVFSVTDHDDFRANAVILSALKINRNAVKFITGTEISSVFDGMNVHLLCYGFDPETEIISRMIEKGREIRRERILALFDHLRVKHNIHIPDEDRSNILGRTIPGKVHIADAAMKLGVKMTRQEFFDKCLNDMESREFKLDAEQVIDMVRSAGGVVSFAHPIEVQKEYDIDIPETASFAKKLKDIGLAAIEVYHSSHGAREVAAYDEIANDYGLLVSGGSDYHGGYKDVQIGQLTQYGYRPDDRAITIVSAVNPPSH